MGLQSELNAPENTAGKPSSLAPKDSELAIASLVTGILGWTLIPILGSVAAIITGHLAKKEIRESQGTLSGNSMSTAGLIMGYIQLGFVVVVAVVLIVLMLVAQNNNWLM